MSDWLTTNLPQIVIVALALMSFVQIFSGRIIASLEKRSTAQVAVNAAQVKTADNLRSDMITQIAAQNTTIDSLRSATTSLQQELTKALVDAGVAQTMNVPLIERVKALEEANTHVKYQLESTITNRDDLAAQVKTMTGEMAVLREQVEKLMKNVSSFDSERAGLLDRITGLLDRISVLERERDALLARIMILEEAIKVAGLLKGTAVKAAAVVADVALQTAGSIKTTATKAADTLGDMSAKTSETLGDMTDKTGDTLKEMAETTAAHLAEEKKKSGG